MLMNKNLADYYMNKYGLDALIVTQPVSVLYFTGLKCVLTDEAQEWNSNPGGSNGLGTNFCILPYEGEPVLLMPSVLAPFGVSTFTRDLRVFGSNPPVTETGEVAIERPEFNDLDRTLLETYGAARYSSPIEAVETVLREKGLLHQSTIGFEQQGFSKSVYDALSRKLAGCSFKDCSDLVRLIRMIKTEDEIALLKRSAEINEMAIRSAAREITDNNTFGDAVFAFNTTAEKHGAVPQHFIFATNGFGVGVEKEYTFRKGQCVLIDSGVYYRNYISDTGTSVMIEPIAPKYKEVFKYLYETVNVGLSHVRPGEKCSKINDSMVEYLASKNINISDTHGHGIGLQPSEYPIIASGRLNYTYNNGFEEMSADFLLEENMVICLEIPVYLYGEASYIVEVSAIVTANGHGAITKQERAVPILNT